MNIKMVIQYDGTDFCGSQIQNGVRTVQGELEKALAATFAQEIRVQFSGRTDTGVHAMDQTVNFYLDTAVPADKVMYLIRKKLPRDINIISSCQVPENFHARFDAKYRIYRYFIRSESDLFRSRYSLLHYRKMDLQILNEHAPMFTGIHDFQSFCSTKAEVKHHLCDVEYIKFYNMGAETVMEIKANRYLHNMVRILVSTFILINDGKLNKEDIRLILEHKNRIYAPKTISPHGLFLWKIGY